MRRDLLEKLIERYRGERDECAARAAKVRRDVLAARSTLETLEGYRRDYRQRAPNAAPQVVAGWQIDTHDRFLRRLDGAVVEQQSRQSSLEVGLAERNAELAECQRRLTAFETLLTRDLRAAQLASRRLDQSSNDEIAARARSAHRKSTK